jgi:hypothetical protein
MSQLRRELDVVAARDLVTGLAERPQMLREGQWSVHSTGVPAMVGCRPER